MFFTEGDVYTGMFNNFEMDGKGTYINSIGDIMHGKFIKDLANGFFKVKYKDGANYQGNYNKGVKEGLGKFKFPDGNIYKGEF